MSISSSNVSLGTIGADAGIPNLNVADIPANIRNGNKAARQAYAEGLGFESVLVNELSQQLANSMYGGAGADGAASSDGLDDSSSSDASDGLLSGASAYSSLIPQALTSSIMSGGGVGLAEEFAQELDPSLNSQSSATGTSSATPTGQTAV